MPKATTTDAAGAALAIEWLGRLPYAQALALQEQTLSAVKAGAGPDRLLLLEHPPVVTLGRSARREHLLLPAAQLARRGIELFEVARGGDVTYHGPGQLVGYLIADLGRAGALDVHAHLRRIEAALIEALARLGVGGRRIPGMTGVFAVGAPEAPPRKLASIGIGVRAGCSFHGFALNVDLDPADFDVIVPCGLHGVRMATLAQELGAAAGADLAERSRAAVARAFAAEWAAPAAAAGSPVGD